MRVPHPGILFSLSSGSASRKRRNGPAGGLRSLRPCEGSLPTSSAHLLGYSPNTSGGRMSRKNQFLNQPNNRNLDQDRLQHRYTRAFLIVGRLACQEYESDSSEWQAP